MALEDPKFESFKDLLDDIQEAYSDDPRLVMLLTLTAKAAYKMGQLGL